MRVHLVDGTYELFRYHFSPGNRDPEHGAARGVVHSMLQLIDDGATHVGVATDQVIESFRNELWPGYKTGEGVPPELMGQFPLVEEALAAAGFCVWPMVEHEADDALGAAARKAALDLNVEQVLICTPDKDLAQCVTADGRIVQYDRRQQKLIDHDGVVDKFGVLPESIPDYLALVGDTADGFPGLPGWGARSTATVLSHYRHLENIPDAVGQWEVSVRGSAKLAATLSENRELALLFRTVATIADDAPTFGRLDELRWMGPTSEFPELMGRMGGEHLIERAEKSKARIGQD
ncbi:MAG: flap endonuclease [Acidimicrobiia bacterium]|nr:flap endonuclease [Acidimicrobiia bacterium]MYG57042.1 flap endonuclease [Acidimicrobiia bacterium]MYJ33349.1 flap endonuclease [Acidimicrobiia bacterium]